MKDEMHKLPAYDSAAPQEVESLLAAFRNIRIIPLLSATPMADDSEEMPDLLRIIRRNEFARHKEIFDRASTTWVLKKLHQLFDSFLEMLLASSEDRCVLPSYFVVALNGDPCDEEILGDLCMFLDRTLDHKILYEGYVEDTRKALDVCYPGSEEIASVFQLYNELLSAKEKKFTRAQVDEIISDSEYGKWFSAYWLATTFAGG